MVLGSSIGSGGKTSGTNPPSISATSTEIWKSVLCTPPGSVHRNDISAQSPPAPAILVHVQSAAGTVIASVIASVIATSATYIGLEVATSTIENESLLASPGAGGTLCS